MHLKDHPARSEVVLGLGTEDLWCTPRRKRVGNHGIPYYMYDLPS